MRTQRNNSKHGCFGSTIRRGGYKDLRTLAQGYEMKTRSVLALAMATTEQIELDKNRP